jgi:hypothetical protein
MKICRENPDLSKSDKNVGQFSRRSKYVLLLAGEINTLQKHFCATPNIFILLAVTDRLRIHQVLLHFHSHIDNANAPQCYVTHTHSAYLVL